MRNIYLLLFLYSVAVSWGVVAIAQEPPVPAAVQAQAESPLTNADVVKLCKLDLGDEVVIAKINQAKNVDFQLDTDSLVSLKTEGVGKPVIEAMLKRATPQSAPAQPVTSSGQASPFLMPAGAAPSTAAVRLATKDRELALQSLQGTSSSTYAFVTVLLFMDYPGLKADARTTDRRPSVVVATQQNPASRFFLVKADSNKKDQDRSVKMGKAGAFSYKGVSQPDKDWTFAYEAKEEQPGLWRLQLKADLKPGEYGLWVGGSGELYDFGVD